MDLSQLKWLKNVKDQGRWAYSVPDDMAIPGTNIFCLHWRNYKDKPNAKEPLKGDLMLLIQGARVTHIVELLDDEVYENKEAEWNIYRIVKAIWMPKNNFNWDKLPGYIEVFGYEDIVFDGLAHRLFDENRMYTFHQHWKPLGGLPAFQKHLGDILINASKIPKQIIGTFNDQPLRYIRSEGSGTELLDIVTIGDCPDENFLQGLWRWVQTDGQIVVDEQALNRARTQV
jgi:hypothetical protein